MNKRNIQQGRSSLIGVIVPATLSPFTPLLPCEFAKIPTEEGTEKGSLSQSQPRSSFFLNSAKANTKSILNCRVIYTSLQRFRSYVARFFFSYKSLDGVKIERFATVLIFNYNDFFNISTSQNVHDC
jgi:hypothetical protein